MLELELARATEWIPDSARDAVSRGLARLLEQRFAGFRHGRLDIVLPDQRIITLGESDATPRARVDIHDARVLPRLFFRGEMGVAEAYEEGLWSSPNLVVALRLFAKNLDTLRFENPLTQAGRLPDRLRHLLRRNNKRIAPANIRAHYDLGNNFYELFLGDSWTYSCALFEEPNLSLEQAQEKKLERVCNALELGPLDHLLDVGCGWGELPMYAARTRGCRVTGITISRQQHAAATARVKAAGLDHQVAIVYRDYRDQGGSYDKISSIEMVEAVGAEYLGGYFATCARVLKPGGRFFLQSILMPEHRYDTYKEGVDWTQSTIFPGCHIPSLAALLAGAEKTGTLRLREFDEIGPHYAPTLRTWRTRLEANRGKLAALGLDDNFFRRFELYLAFSEASFAERTLGNAQMLFTRAP